MTVARAVRPVILVADPVESTAELFRQVCIDEFNAYVSVVHDADALLVAVREARPRLILFEVSSQRAKDCVAVERIKTDPLTATIPLYVLTAWGSSLGCDELLALGADACTVKPFELADVIDRARQLLERPRA